VKFGGFDLSIVRECRLRLDGGAMFGVVPKVLWNKVSPADQANRVLLTCNLLVIETPTARVLIETGMGHRWDEKEKERYALEPLGEGSEPLKSVGLKARDIDAVIISHLHFDHAGGATYLKDGKIIPTFPKAKYYSQRGEWEFAHQANARARASYRPDDFEPLQQHGQLTLIDGDTEIVQGIWAKLTGGHTSHHQIVYFESEGQKGVFFADIMPTRSHVSPPWVMGYDHYPLHSCDLKSEWLAKAAKEKWLVVFDHEPGVPWGHITLDESKKYVFEPLAEESLRPTRTEKLVIGS
jgi:glyoxylase-like metal-dependent hydrolase (beta-lactamase superfamily II)